MAEIYLPKKGASVNHNRGTKNTEKTRPTSRLKGFVLFLIMVVVSLWMGVAPVAAADINGSETSISSSLASIGPMITDIAGIMPAVGLLLVSVIGIAILLIGYKFVIGILSSILDAIRTAFNFRL